MATRRPSREAMRGATTQMLALEAYLRTTGLGEQLLHLVKMRASQINGCAYCLVMHAADLRTGGEREERIHVLNGWREAPWFSDRERAALADLTLAIVAINGWNRINIAFQVPPDVFAEARSQFGERELADLTLAIVAINGWNRINIAFQVPPAPFTFKPCEPLVPATATSA